MANLGLPRGFTRSHEARGVEVLGRSTAPKIDVSAPLYPLDHNRHRGALPEGEKQELHYSRDRHPSMVSAWYARGGIVFVGMGVLSPVLSHCYIGDDRPLAFNAPAGITPCRG